MTSEVKRGWCAMLAKLTAPMASPEAAAAFVAMLPMLPKEDAAFNRDTLERAARRETGDTAVPNYDRLARAFSEWRKDNLHVQIRMGGSVQVGQLIAPTYEPTDAERDRVDAQVAALKAEFASTPGAKELKIEPKYPSKLQLALNATEAVLATRPDYRAVLEMHRGGEGRA